MARQKKRYMNKQKRGGNSPAATDTRYGSVGNKNQSPKDYHKQAVAHHGGEMALESFLESIKK